MQSHISCLIFPCCRLPSFSFRAGLPQARVCPDSPGAGKHVGGVAWGGTAAAKGKQSLGDGSALSPHLSSGKALFSSALGCSEPGTPAHDFPAVSARLAWGGSLKTVDHSTQQLLATGPTPRHVWATAREAGGSLPCLWGILCGDGPLCPQDLPFSSSALVSSSPDINLSSFAASLLSFPHSQESHASRTLWNRPSEASFTALWRTIKLHETTGAEDGHGTHQQSEPPTPRSPPSPHGRA